MHPVTGAERLQALVFLVVGLLLVLGAASLLTGFPFRKERHLYYVEFDESVAAVQVGSSVLYRGVRTGKISDITIKPPGDKILVALAVDDAAPVTSNTKARIASAGLLGPYFVELFGGGGDRIPEGATIPADQSTMRRILDAGTGGLENLNALLASLRHWTSEENRERLEKLVDTMTRALDDADAAIRELKPDAARLVSASADLATELKAAAAENREAFRRLVEDASATATGVRRFVEAGRLDLASDQAGRLMDATREEVRATGVALRTYLDENRVAPLLERAVTSLERLETSASSALGVVEGETATLARAELGPALRALRESVRTLQELLASLRDDPALLLFSEPRPEIVPPPAGGRR